LEVMGINFTASSLSSASILYALFHVDSYRYFLFPYYITFLKIKFLTRCGVTHL
jgi:hypothetical protein